MLKRTAAVSFLHRSGLAGMESGIIERLKIQGKRTYHDDLVYSALIQCGVDRFVSASASPKAQEKLAESHGNRIIIDNTDVYHKQLQKIQDLLSQHLVGPNTEKNKSTLFGLALFLNDLLYSLDKKSSMIVVLPFPDPKKLDGLLSPHVTLAVRSLLLSLTKVELALPTAQFEIQRGNVIKLQEILESNSFSNYSKGHQLMENNDEKTPNVVQHLSSTAVQLKKKYDRVLDFNKMALSLIPVSTKLVDTFCGGIPGKLAQIFEETLTPLLKDKKKIVIYDYGEAHNALLNDHYSALKRFQLSSLPMEEGDTFT